MQAVVLAAGESSRFYPYSSLGHKGLVTLLGKTLIERTLDSIADSGIKKIVVIEDNRRSVSLSLKNYKSADLKFVVQKKPLGMGDALLSAESFLEDEFFVTSAYHLEFSIFKKELANSKNKTTDIVILTKEDKEISSFGVIDRSGGKLRVDEKPKDTRDAERIVGIYLLNKKFVEVLKNTKKSHYNFEEAISKYSDVNSIVLVKTDQKTLSLKHPWDLFDIKDYLLGNVKTSLGKTSKIARKANIKGEGILIEDGVEVMDGVVVMGPCYLGKNAYVGNNTIIRGGTVIEEGVRVGAQMELKNSILMKGATTHSGFIGDSIIGENTKIAASFNTGNVRLDRGEVSSIVKGEKVNTHMKRLGAIIGSNTSFGIKVGTMPGIIIGNNVIVGPGTTVMENIEDNTTYYAEFKKTVQKKNDTKK